MRRSIVWNIVIVCVVILWSIPLVWMAWGAFVPTSVITGATDLRVSSLTVSNFLEAFSRKPWLSGFANSMMVAIVSTASVLMIALPCAYGLSRSKGGRAKFSGWLFSTRMLPPAAVLVSLLFLYQVMGIIDSWASLVIANLGSNLGIIALLLSGYLGKVDRSFEDVLRNQGYSMWESFLISSFARSKMPILFSSVVCFLFCWNEFFFASAFTAGGTSQTLPVIVSGFITSQDVMWGPMFASCLLMVVPAALGIWFLEKTLLRGLTFGIVASD